MWLLDINKKPYMGSPMTLSYLNLSDLERSKSSHSDFNVLYLVKGTELGHMLLLNIYRKAYMFIDVITFDFSDLEG